MTVLVQKYGGSSVADVEKIGQVADRVVAAKQAGNDVVVVVSAMGKTTDGLLALRARASAPTPRAASSTCCCRPASASRWRSSPSPSTRAAATPSASPARSPASSPTTATSTRASSRCARIASRTSWRAGKIVIVAGYQGMSYRREITTLGRGGSDTTAVALAAALGAERCEIYSDVDGVYSADPRVVPDARHLPELDLAIAPGDGRGGRQGGQRAGRRVGAAREDRDLRAQDERSGRRRRGRPSRSRAAEPKHVRAVVGLDKVVHARLPARGAARASRRSRRSSTCRCSTSRRGGARDVRHPAAQRARLGARAGARLEEKVRGRRAGRRSAPWSASWATG